MMEEPGVAKAFAHEPFHWSPDFDTGFAKVDAQHRHLLDLINQLAPANATALRIDFNAEGGLLDELATYAVSHFADEEQLMMECGLAPAHIALHCEQHRQFVDDVARMRGEFAAGNGDATPLWRFLTAWFAFHVLGTDQLMAEQLRAVAAGCSPEAAYRDAHEQPNIAARPLLEAVTTLYRFATDRSRALADSNRRLEDTVVARTAELRQEKEALAALVVQMQQTQSQLLHAEKLAAVGQLAAGVAHEINNPIGFVISNLGTLEGYIGGMLPLIDAYAALEPRLADEPALRQQLREFKRRAELDYVRTDIGPLLDESLAGLQRVKRIVADLKDFSHVGEAEWQDVDLNAQLESTLNVAWHEVSQKAEVVRDLAPLPPVSCLAAEINQVFMNLLINAAQAIDTRGTIRLRSRHEGDWVRIEVADTGRGMTDAVREHIFEPFFTTQPVGMGQGLGLSIAWDIVQKHGGELSAASSPGAGTCIMLRLPLRRAVSRHDDTPPPAPTSAFRQAD